MKQHIPSTPIYADVEAEGDSTFDSQTAAHTGRTPVQITADRRA